MKKMIMQFLKDEEGVTMIEYALMAALIAVALIVVVKGVGTETNGIFTTIKDEIAGATN